METNQQTKFIAITGGSGAGKTWLADRLQRVLGTTAARLSLDDFYLDGSSLPPADRAKVNFDHPDAIDWPFFEGVLRNCCDGRSTRVPRYDFATHRRLPFAAHFMPAPLVLVEGLWLLWQPQVHELFDLIIFLECPAQLRLARRLARDVAERSRSEESVRAQFKKSVAPMHDRFVAPQARWADLTLTTPVSETGFNQLRELLERDLLRGVLPAGKEAREAITSRCFIEEKAMGARSCPGLSDFADGSPLLTTCGASGMNSRGASIHPD